MRNILDRFAVKFARIVEKYTDYIVVSGFVAISSGRSRSTEDIDMIILPVTKNIFLKMHDELLRKGFTCIQSDDVNEVFGYLKDLLPVRYIENNKPLPELELKFAKDELDSYQFQTKTKLRLTGLELFFSNVNVNIAFKEFLLKSPKDLEDARHLRAVYLVSEDEISHVVRLIKKCRMIR